MHAHVVEQVVKIQSAETLPNGVGVLIVDLDVWSDTAHEAFLKLPAALFYGSRVYGKSAFDSDRNVAFYRSDVALARVDFRKLVFPE